MILSYSIYGQDITENTDVKAPAPWGFTAGAFISTHGGGGQLNYLWGRGRRQLMVSLDAYLLEDDRETKIESAFGDQGGKYTFGKINHVFLITPSIGFQQNLFPANDNNLINFRVGAQIGPTIAMSTPYFIEVFTPAPGRPSYGFGTVVPYDPEAHRYEDIIRRVKLFNSDFDFTTNIGLSIRTHLLIDFTKGKNYVGALQLGVNVDTFAESLPIMAFVDNNKTFVTGTIGLVFGFRK